MIEKQTTAIDAGVSQRTRAWLCDWNITERGAASIVSGRKPLHGLDTSQVKFEGHTSPGVM